MESVTYTIPWSYGDMISCFSSLQLEILIKIPFKISIHFNMSSDKQNYESNCLTLSFNVCTNNKQDLGNKLRFCALMYVNSASCLLILLRAFGQQHWPMKRSLTEHSKSVLLQPLCNLLHSIIPCSWDGTCRLTIICFLFLSDGFFHLS